MKTRLKTRALLRIASVGLLLGTAWLAQAAITIVKDDGSICTEGTINVDGTVTPVEASCSAPPPAGSFSLTVSKAGAGTVTGTGFNCGTDCTEFYAGNTPMSVTLTATADTGYSFTGWSGAGCTGTGTCTVATTIAANLTVTATFTADAAPPPPTGSCGALPANTVVIDTGSITTAWPQTTNIVPPQQITAFKFTVPSGFAKRENFNVAKTGSGEKSKLVVVSTCPGVLTPVGTYCSLAGTDTTTVRLSGKSSDPSYYCKLAPGVYYANAVSKNTVTDSTYNCSSSTKCSFYASRSAPY